MHSKKPVRLGHPHILRRVCSVIKIDILPWSVIIATFITLNEFDCKFAWGGIPLSFHNKLSLSAATARDCKFPSSGIDKTSMIWKFNQDTFRNLTNVKYSQEYNKLCTLDFESSYRKRYKDEFVYSWPCFFLKHASFFFNDVKL